MEKTVVFRARKIITMDHNRPHATHVMVRGGRILAVGDADIATLWGGAPVDDRYADKVLMPGLIEAHAHVSAGGIFRFSYCGHYARLDPDGRNWPGATTADAIVERLREVAVRTEKGKPVVGFGFDPTRISATIDRDVLDRVSQEHPVLLIHSSMHVLVTNTAGLKVVGMEQGSNVPGVVSDRNGRATGELQEFAAMGPLMAHANVTFRALGDEAGLRAYADLSRRVGVTTVTDMYAELEDEEVTRQLRITGEDSFPIRYVPAMNAMRKDPVLEAERALDLRAMSTDKLHLGRAKLFTDGSIQGWTAKLNAPGYYTGTDHGIWNMPVDDFRNAVKVLHRAGVKMHIHTNGDAASELACDAVAGALLGAGNADLRHTLEHVQLADRAQFERMRKLGLTVNLFGNHLYYFGDAHWEKTVGPDRAARMNACRDAAAVWGGNFAIHSDAPVTPMSPLFTAWCAVNRKTESGRVLGDTQQLSVEQAMYCITMGAAHVLKLDHEIGSISCGKRADFCVLEDDPLAAAPGALKDLRIAGTVLGGVHFPLDG
ncbi:amidohydrolase [Pararhodobacter sp.]|uniref:amidohydrolase n=1 Tax=Pararhodobacter sp. TaxID=2127056 RepID=UPI002FDCC94F